MVDSLISTYTGDMFSELFQKFYRSTRQRSTRCNICFSTHLETRRFTFRGEAKPNSYMRHKTMNFLLCLDCGYSYCRENYKDYIKLGADTISSPENYLRVGDGLRPGREFYMAREAIDILRDTDFFLPQEAKEKLNRKKFKVLIFAPGNSLDHELLRKLDSVAECKITDLENFQKSSHFVPLETRESFDVVIACEVVEHFTRPRKEFGNLFRYLNRTGILVVSTNIRKDEDFSERTYPFLYGHTSYYSGKSFIFLAEMNGLLIDFRTPIGPTFNLKSKIKNFTYMTRSQDSYRSLQNHFSIKSYPECE